MVLEELDFNARMNSKKVLDYVESYVRSNKKPVFLYEDWRETKEGVKVIILLCDSKDFNLPTHHSCNIKNKYLTKCFKENMKFLKDNMLNDL